MFCGDIPVVYVVIRLEDKVVCRARNQATEEILIAVSGNFYSKIICLVRLLVEHYGLVARCRRGWFVSDTGQWISTSVVRSKCDDKIYLLLNVIGGKFNLGNHDIAQSGIDGIQLGGEMQTGIDMLQQDKEAVLAFLPSCLAEITKGHILFLVTVYFLCLRSPTQSYNNRDISCCESIVVIDGNNGSIGKIITASAI